MITVSKRNEKNDQRVLRINFEDLILQYDDTKKTVFDFLDIDGSDHVNKFKYFDPNVSNNNVGVWKKYKNQDDINKIYKELKEYCYQGI